jgi:hypothetical protein
MPPIRLIEPLSLQHCISRIVDRKDRIHDRARKDYLSFVGHALRRSDWIVLGYAIMSNHVHWAMLAGEAPLDVFFHSLHGRFARGLNRDEHRLGPVFAARPRNLVVAEEGAGHLIAYIHNNPVRAGVVPDASLSDWTSQNAYLGTVAPPPWLHVERGLEVAGYSSPAKFADFVRSRANETRDQYHSEEHERAARVAIRAATRAPVEIVMAAAPQIAIVGRPGTPLRPPQPADLGVVLQTVACRTGVSVLEMQTLNRRAAVVHARRVALVVWCILLGQRLVNMAAVLGLGQSGASMLLSRDALVAGALPDAQAVVKALGAGVMK